LIHIQYNLSDKTFEQVTLTGATEIIIDFFNEAKGVGVEYLNDAGADDQEASQIIPSGQTIEYADKTSDYSLAIKSSYYSNEEGITAIKEQVTAFFDWLKAEGII